VALDAQNLFLEMNAAISEFGFIRESGDPESPMKDATVEAAPWSSFVLRSPRDNAPNFRKLNWRWAVAHILHFFTGSEDARTLKRYNPIADRFLSNGYWLGAYGHNCLWQIQTCIEILKNSPSTRRAIVTQGDLGFQDANRPACWNLLHFLVVRRALHMHVSQRSLNLFGVYPYDVTLLTNILLHVSTQTGIEAGFMHWTIGSLHKKPSDEAKRVEGCTNLVLPSCVLANTHECHRWLENPESASEPWRTVLCG
jgi:hypothetical protein